MLTGASGFIGRHLTSRLLSDRRHEIFCLVRPGTPCASGVTPVLCDLARHETIESFPPVETIIHLAQSHQYRNFPIAAEDIFAINTLATARLLDYGTPARRRRDSSLPRPPASIPLATPYARRMPLCSLTTFTLRRRSRPKR